MTMLYLPLKTSVGFVFVLGVFLVVVVVPVVFLFLDLLTWLGLLVGFILVGTDDRSPDLRACEA
jgi:hypothetical protein